MKPVLFVATFAAAILFAPLPAQSFSLAAPVPTVVTIQTGTTQQATLNPGPMAAEGVVVAGGIGLQPNALFRWSSADSVTNAIYEATVAGWNNAATGQFAITPGEVLLQLSAPVTTSVHLVMSRQVSQPFGAPAPTFLVDVFDDGTLELTASQPPSTPASMALVIGPIPTPIRTRVAVGQTGIGSSEVHLRLEVKPNVGVTTEPWPVGCGAFYQALPTFGDELALVAQPNTGEFTVGVLGLGFQPVFLGIPVSVPCFAFPGPDFLVPFATFGLERFSIPAAARPFQFWTQGITVRATGLIASDVFHVTAQ